MVLYGATATPDPPTGSAPTIAGTVFPATLIPICSTPIVGAAALAPIASILLPASEVGKIPFTTISYPPIPSYAAVKVCV